MLDGCEMNSCLILLAEGEGFEPPKGLAARWISKECGKLFPPPEGLRR